MFTEQKFQINKLEGMSEKSIEEHLKLYAGYVKNANMILDLLEKGAWEGDGGVYAKNELQRRFGFEYNGMRNHEIYFSLLEGEGSGSVKDTAPTLGNTIADQWGNFETWVNNFQALANTRGIGWAMLYYDRKEKKLLNAWIDEQHLGQLQDCSLILALDVWEHSYVADYYPSGKKQYIEDFFKNINWSVAEKYFLDAQNKV
jgi:Fe-Mn family superoxide dismutase